ncbi:MAG: lipid-A-disaccharide synthase [Flavobacteriaceae bacterium TMED184]|nr:MAG: lipid-A-disaccharide synthase [Flavobacteriaceae bacterium TMED184]|tara:strand:+ start:138 stop:1241 length:1104 start_codon:yes stop_codon:yes gene_type:complete
MNKEKIFIIAGEDSGDLHGASLISEIKKINPKAQFFGVGGNRMQKEGLVLTQHIKKLNIIGFFEVLKHYRRIKKIFNETLLEIKKINPNKIILIDYPGFNLRMAKKLHGLNFDITYFILPQVWAWKESRIKTLTRYCTRLISIIPFEKKWFKKRGVKVHYAGHPLSILSKKKYNPEHFRLSYNIPKKNKIIALLPGSRKSEVEKNWKIFSETIKILKSKTKNLTFLLIEGQNVSIHCESNIIKIKNNQYEAIKSSNAAIVCSGTATLETAMLKCPMVVCYKTSYASWVLVKILSRVKFISLVNLIAEEKVVAECVQKKMNAKNLSNEIISLLDTKKSEAVKEKYEQIIKTLKTKHNPYKEAAKNIYA